jgi:tetratricopeptide (TPR) repeat protein
MSEGRFDEATTQMDLALQLDPTSLTVNVGRGRLYFYMRRYEQAMRVFQKLIEQEPNDLSLQQSLISIYEQRRMYPMAVETLLKMQASRGVPPARCQELKEVFATGGWEGLLREQLRRTRRATCNARSSAGFGVRHRLYSSRR